MCAYGDGVPGSAAEALRLAGTCLDYLNSPAAGLEAASIGDVLVLLGGLRSRLTAAHAGLLRRFDAADGHDADGYPTPVAWLTAMAKMSPRAAKASVRQMRQLTGYPDAEQAMARGELSESWFTEIWELTRKLPEELRAGTAKILLDATLAGACLDDLKLIAAAAYEQWRSQRPDPDEDDGFDDRFVQVGSTFGGAAVIRGNLTPECGAAVQAVLESLGKRHGPEDMRSEGQRYHDALQLGCELLLRARLVPDRAGADTTVVAHVPLGALRDMPGASALEQAWLGARAGQPGYLAGKDAQAAACDAMVVPVVTGHADMAVIDRIIDLALAAAGGWHHQDTTPGDGTGGGHGDDNRSSDSGSGSGVPGQARPGDPGASPALTGMSPDARDALRHAIARLAIDFVSGPNGLASLLRTNLLERPYSTPSLPLDIGYSATIPASIRRAVQLRDKGCAWPRCDRSAVHCDVHHLHHKADGGKTSVRDCVLLCQYHHDICIHRQGWRLILHPDGTTTAHGPRGQVLHSHSPPTARAG